MRRSERLLPARVAHGLARAVSAFSEGLAAVRQPSGLFGALAWSLALWLTYGMVAWLVSRAFSIALPMLGSCLLLALNTVGVSLPTPGGVGGFHQAYRVGVTMFFGASPEQAVGAGIVLHAISFVPVAIVGAVFMMQDGLSLSTARQLTLDPARGGERGEMPILRTPGG